MAKEISVQDIGPTSNPNTLNTLWKKIWSINSPRVVKMFLWNACSNILPTKENLYKRKIANDPPICDLWKGSRNNRTCTVELPCGQVCFDGK
jgi:hypothetical protein